MSINEVEPNDLSLLLIRYKDLYLKELTYYGTTETDQMFILINVGQEISRLENIIVETHYKTYIKKVQADLTNPNMYYLQKILFESFDIVNCLTMLWMINKSNSEEFEYKSRYLVGSIENFVDKFMDPIDLILKQVVCSNKIYKIKKEQLVLLKKFLIINKNKFSNPHKINRLEKFIKLFE